ncbi:MAG: hypothetical protein WCG27_00515, partial [Pseudomonadota bacterium]
MKLSKSLLIMLAGGCIILSSAFAQENRRDENLSEDVRLTLQELRALEDQLGVIGVQTTNQ